MTQRLQQSKVRPILLFVICSVFVAGYVWSVICAYRAQRLADQHDLISLTDATALEPRNATFHEQLCRVMIYSVNATDRAIEECKKASVLNPYSSAIWLDLAQAYYSAGKKELNQAAIHKALVVDPTTPDTMWSAANYFLLQGDTSAALQLFAVILREEPSLVPSVLGVCWQSLHDVQRIQAMLPPKPDIYLSFVKLLLASREFEAANHIWAALMQMPVAVDYRQALFYIDGLLQVNAVDQAHDAWMQLLTRSKELRAYAEPGNLIMDGTFSHEILDSGFDWRYKVNPQIAVALDSAESHSGNRSLRLTYTDSGSDAGIFQYIAVQPTKQYRLSAWVKSEELETANGPMLSIVDGVDKMIYGTTEETSGTTPWHRIEATVTTGPETRLAAFSVLRNPGETRIQGNFWIDDVRLEPIR
jgi:tetratricopeptide (TPR) repeat protein